MAIDRPNGLELETRWFLGPAEAARLLDVGRSTIYELAAKGELPTIRINGSVQISVDGMKDWIRKKMNECDSGPILD